MLKAAGMLLSWPSITAVIAVLAAVVATIEACEVHPADYPVIERNRTQWSGIIAVPSAGTGVFSVLLPSTVTWYDFLTKTQYVVARLPERISELVLVDRDRVLLVATPPALYRYDTATGVLRLVNDAISSNFTVGPSTSASVVIGDRHSACVKQSTLSSSYEFTTLVGVCGSPGRARGPNASDDRLWYIEAVADAGQGVVYIADEGSLWRKVGTSRLQLLNRVGIGISQLMTLATDSSLYILSRCQVLSYNYGSNAVSVIGNVSSCTSSAFGLIGNGTVFVSGLVPGDGMSGLQAFHCGPVFATPNAAQSPTVVLQGPSATGAPTLSPAETSNRRSSTQLLIAIIVVGCVGGILLVTCIVVVLIKCRKPAHVARSNSIVRRPSLRPIQIAISDEEESSPTFSNPAASMRKDESIGNVLETRTNGTSTVSHDPYNCPTPRNRIETDVEVEDVDPTER